jgi:hypothetical protein
MLVADSSITIDSGNAMLWIIGVLLIIALVIWIILALKR